MWILTGLAVRLGQRLELAAPKGTVFETQICRRVWWQVTWLDGRASQLAGQWNRQLFRALDIEDSPLPANLNDADISPNMSGIPPSHDGPTEMVFCLSRYETGVFLINHSKELHSPGTSVAERDMLINDLEEHLENKYLTHCDPAIPLHQLAKAEAHSSICKMRLIAHHPAQYPDKGKSMPQSEHDMLFFTSLEMAELHVQAYSGMAQGLDNYFWQVDNSFQLDALVFMLIESQYQPPTGEAIEKAWSLIDSIFEHRPQLLSDTNGALQHAALRQLVLNAWAARETEAHRRGSSPLSLPDIISRLRRRPSDSMDIEDEGASDRASDADGAAKDQPPRNGQVEEPADGTVLLGWEPMDWKSWDHWNDLLQVHVAE